MRTMTKILIKYVKYIKKSRDMSLLFFSNSRVVIKSIIGSDRDEWNLILNRDELKFLDLLQVKTCMNQSENFKKACKLENSLHNCRNKNEN